MVEGNYSIEGKLLNMVPTTYKMNTRKMEVGGSEVQGHP